MPIGMHVFTHRPLDKKMATRNYESHNQKIDAALSKANDTLTPAEAEKLESLKIEFPSGLKSIEGINIKDSGQGVRNIVRAHLWMLENLKPCTGIISVFDWNLGRSGENVIILEAINQVHKYYNAFLDACAAINLSPSIIVKLGNLDFLATHLKNNANAILEPAANEFKEFAVDFLKILTANNLDEPGVREMYETLNTPSPNYLTLINDLLSPKVTKNYKDLIDKVIEPSNIKLVIKKESILPEKVAITSTLSPTSSAESPSYINSTETANVSAAIPVVFVNLYTRGHGSSIQTTMAGLEKSILQETDLNKSHLFQIVYDQMRDFANQESIADGTPLDDLWNTVSLSRESSGDSIIVGTAKRSKSANSGSASPSNSVLGRQKRSASNLRNTILVSSLHNQVTQGSRAVSAVSTPHNLDRNSSFNNSFASPSHKNSRSNSYVSLNYSFSGSPAEFDLDASVRTPSASSSSPSYIDEQTGLELNVGNTAELSKYYDEAKRKFEEFQNLALKSKLKMKAIASLAKVREIQSMPIARGTNAQSLPRANYLTDSLNPSDDIVTDSFSNTATLREVTELKIESLAPEDLPKFHKGQLVSPPEKSNMKFELIFSGDLILAGRQETSAFNSSKKFNYSSQQVTRPITTCHPTAVMISTEYKPAENFIETPPEEFSRPHTPTEGNLPPKTTPVETTPVKSFNNSLSSTERMIVLPKPIAMKLNDKSGDIFETLSQFKTYQDWDAHQNGGSTVTIANLLNLPQDESKQSLLYDTRSSNASSMMNSEKSSKKSSPKLENRPLSAPASLFENETNLIVSQLDGIHLEFEKTQNRFFNSTVSQTHPVSRAFTPYNLASSPLADSSTSDQTSSSTMKPELKH